MFSHISVHTMSVLTRLVMSVQVARLLHGIDLTAYFIPHVENRWFDGKPHEARGAIGEINDVADVEAALVPASDGAWQTSVVPGS